MRVVFLSLFSVASVLAQQHVVENGVCYRIDDNGARVIEDCVIPTSSTASSTSASTSSASPTVDDKSKSNQTSGDKVREVGNLGALVMFLFALM
jgi:hypothetical protein